MLENLERNKMTNEKMQIMKTFQFFQPLEDELTATFGAVILDRMNTHYTYCRVHGKKIEMYVRPEYVKPGSKYSNYLGSFDWGVGTDMYEPKFYFYLRFENQNRMGDGFYQCQHYNIAPHMLDTYEVTQRYGFLNLKKRSHQFDRIRVEHIKSDIQAYLANLDEGMFKLESLVEIF
jgi:hypothetical protein